MNVPEETRIKVQLPILMLQRGFFIRYGTRKRKAPNTNEYVEPNIPTSGCAVRMAKNWGSVIGANGFTSYMRMIMPSITTMPK